MTKEVLLKELTNKLLKLKLLRVETKYRGYFDGLDSTIEDFNIIINSIKSGKCNTLLDISNIAKYNYAHYFKLRFKTNVIGRSLKDLAIDNNNSFDNIIGLNTINVMLMDHGGCYNIEI